MRASSERKSEVPLNSISQWTGSNWARHDRPAELPGVPRDLAAFAFDGLGNLALLYTLDPGDGSRSLAFALREGSAWRQEIVDTRIGYWSHLAWDPVREKFAAHYEPPVDGNSSGLNRFYLSREPLTAGTAWDRELSFEAHWAWADGFVYDSTGAASMLYMFDDKTLALTSRGPAEPAWGPSEILECGCGRRRPRPESRLDRACFRSVAADRHLPLSDPHSRRSLIIPSGTNRWFRTGPLTN